MMNKHPGEETPELILSQQLHPGAEVFISVCPTFAGRVVRGDPIYSLNRTLQNNLGTWIELSWEGPPTRRS